MALLLSLNTGFNLHWNISSMIREVFVVVWLIYVAVETRMIPGMWKTINKYLFKSNICFSTESDNYLLLQKAKYIDYLLLIDARHHLED